MALAVSFIFYMRFVSQAASGFVEIDLIVLLVMIDRLVRFSEPRLRHRLRSKNLFFYTKLQMA